MSDPSMLAGAGIFLAGMLADRAWPSRRRGPKPLRPICGCGHHHSFHHAETGACGATEESLTHYDVRHEPVYEQIPCGCQRYSGPEPLPQFYAPEVTG